jgi:hypothetical protein
MCSRGRPCTSRPASRVGGSRARGGYHSRAHNPSRLALAPFAVRRHSSKTAARCGRNNVGFNAKIVAYKVHNVRELLDDLCVVMQFASIVAGLVCVRDTYMRLGSHWWKARLGWCRYPSGVSHSHPSEALQRRPQPRCQFPRSRSARSDPLRRSRLRHFDLRKRGRSLMRP